MATATDKKRWKQLHDAHEKARSARFEQESALRAYYGPNFQMAWLARGERDKLERRRAKENQIGQKIIDLIVRVSPRGEAWLSGVPTWWLEQKLTWEDAIRPADEPLSVVVPGAYGYPDGYVREAPRTRDALKPRRAEFEIATATPYGSGLPPGRMTVKGYVAGDYGMRKEKWFWEFTHLPTGTKLLTTPPIEKLDQALAHLEDLARNGPKRELDRENISRGGWGLQENKGRTVATDFEDEDSVLADMARALDTDADELYIEEDRGLISFRTGTVYRVDWGIKEYTVVENDDQMRELALEIVKQDLEQEPEIFNKDFLERHINTDRLRRDLEPDLLNSRIDDLTHEAERNPDRFWEDYEREGFEAPEEDEDGERREPEQTEIEELAEHMVEEELRDPMRYLEDIYGDEAAAQAIEIAGIDIDAAAEDAVDTDGAEHFVARYDGNYHETPGGLVYWRSN